MTITEYGKMIKREKEEYVVFIKYGKFYRSYDYDAYIMHYLFKYKLTSRETVGFPIENINKILGVFKDKNISAIVVNGIDSYVVYECLSNKYDFYLKESLNYLNFNESVNVLIDLINNKLSDDYNLFPVIRSFLDNL